MDSTTPTPAPAPAGGTVRPLKMKRRPGPDRVKRSDWTPTPYAKAVGGWLKKRRDQLGISQREAARRGQCSCAWICQLETASADIWATTIRSCAALCEAYSLEMETLLRVLRVIRQR
jgi:hypothetical protein